MQEDPILQMAELESMLTNAGFEFLTEEKEKELEHTRLCDSVMYALSHGSLDNLFEEKPINFGEIINHVKQYMQELIHGYSVERTESYFDKHILDQQSSDTNARRIIRNVCLLQKEFFPSGIFFREESNDFYDINLRIKKITQDFSALYLENYGMKLKNKVQIYDSYLDNL